MLWQKKISTGKWIFTYQLIARPANWSNKKKKDTEFHTFSKQVLTWTAFFSLKKTHWCEATALQRNRFWGRKLNCFIHSFIFYDHFICFRKLFFVLVLKKKANKNDAKWLEWSGPLFSPKAKKFFRVHMRLGVHLLVNISFKHQKQMYRYLLYAVMVVLKLNLLVFAWIRNSNLR